MDDRKRIFAIVSWHTVGMCALGYLGSMTAFLRHDPASAYFAGFVAWAVLATPLILMVAGTLGLATAVVSVVILHRAVYFRAMVLVYAVAAIPTIHVAWTDPIFSGERAVGLAAFSVVLLLALRGLCRPSETIFSKPEGVCSKCKFDLSIGESCENDETERTGEYMLTQRARNLTAPQDSASRRASGIIALHMVGMCSLGAVAFVVSAGATEGFDSLIREFWAVLLLLPIVVTVAACVGAFTCAASVLVLYHAKYFSSLVFIYSVAMIPTIYAAWTNPMYAGERAAGPAAIAVVLLLILRGIWRPRETIFAKREGLCPKCEYDLTGCTEPGCPECGWGRGADTIQQ